MSTYLGVQSTRNRVKNEADYHISYSLAKRLPSATAAGTNPRCSSGAVCEPNNIPSWLDWVTNLRNQNDGAGRYYPDLAYKIGDPQNASYGGYGTFETTRKSLVAKQDYPSPLAGLPNGRKRGINALTMCTTTQAAPPAPPAASLALRATTAALKGNFLPRAITTPPAA